MRSESAQPPPLCVSFVFETVSWCILPGWCAICAQAAKQVQDRRPGPQTKAPEPEQLADSSGPVSPSLQSQPQLKLSSLRQDALARQPAAPSRCDSASQQPAALESGSVAATPVSAAEQSGSGPQQAPAVQLVPQENTPWVRKLDVASNRYYYVHRALRTTTWQVRPAAPASSVRSPRRAIACDGAAGVGASRGMAGQARRTKPGTAAPDARTASGTGP